MQLFRSRYFVENQRNYRYLAAAKKLKALTEVKENQKKKKNKTQELSTQYAWNRPAL